MRTNIYRVRLWLRNTHKVWERRFLAWPSSVIVAVALAVEIDDIEKNVVKLDLNNWASPGDSDRRNSWRDQQRILNDFMRMSNAAKAWPCPNELSGSMEEWVSIDGVDLGTVTIELEPSFDNQVVMRDCVPAKQAINLGRDAAYRAIDGERNYQDALSVGPDGRTDGHQKNVGDYLTLLRVYFNKADAAYAGHSGNLPALHEIRKVAAIAVKCMEEHGAPLR